MNKNTKVTDIETVIPSEWDHILVGFSGGKDSIACILHLLELGFDRSKIELWHHDIDGHEGSDLMDWNITRDYCRAFARAMDLPLYFSWKVGGFEGEMLREDARTQPVKFETPSGEVGQAGGIGGKKSTRRMFPQVSPSLSQRWCSAYLKIDVCRMAVNNQERFLGKRVLVVTGERAEESASRAKYAELEPHSSNSTRRTAFQWRPVHKWSESQVWDIMRRWKINPHPAYKLGWGRVSCAACIFGNKDQWASLRRVYPARFERIAGYEEEFGKTIHRTKSVRELAESGSIYEMDDVDVYQARESEYLDDIIVEVWELPAGAFKETGGPS